MGKQRGRPGKRKKERKRRLEEAAPTHPVRDGDAGPRADDSRMVAVLSTFHEPTTTGFDQAWIGMEPTFQSKRTVRLWEHLAAREGGEVDYFEHPYMLELQERIARRIVERYQADLAAGAPTSLFGSVHLRKEKDPWGFRRQGLRFRFREPGHRDLKVRVTTDPETIEFSIKPVPLEWFHLDEFVDFLQAYIWDVPASLGLVGTLLHGGCQFSISAKTFMVGSLLVDDIATRLNHPELSCFVMDFPNPDDRPFRATRKRYDAFRRLIEAYWEGGFHPSAVGTLTSENAIWDRGWGPAANPPPGLVDPRTGPVGSPREVFQTNFAFGRAVRKRAQVIHCGYWQSAHVRQTGYRPDQIGRYGEGNLNRLQIAGECHVKSDKVLDEARVPEYDAPLDLAMVYREATWEYRGQVCKSSARDFVESLLLYTNHARWLMANPHVTVVPTLAQDLLLMDGEETVRRYGGAALLGRLRREARAATLEASGGRIKTDFLEPGVLFWEAWRVLPRGERAVIAHEVIDRFVEYVHQAATSDPRPGSQDRDPMEWHRHRIMPLLWTALDKAPRGFKVSAAVKAEHKAFLAHRPTYLARRPEFSPLGRPPPWHGL